MLGLQVLDWIVIGIYVVVLIAIGIWTRRRVTTTQEFYQGNRSFGRSLMAFLNFGTMTDAGQTAGVTSEIYRQGLQGVWFQNLVLFHTPFQWFIAALQRRARYLAPGDLYQHRFESRSLAGLYAVVLVASAIVASSFGYIITGKTLKAVMVKPPAEYTVTERENVAAFQRLKELRIRDYAALSAGERSTLDSLTDRELRGEIDSIPSYLDLNTFCIIYALLIAGYTALGGLLAIAIIDVIQGILIVFLSLILIPIALDAIGGISGMHDHIPQQLFSLFGTSAASDYTWYFVASFALLNLVVNAPKSFTIGGAARDESAARIGFITGSIFKRIMMIAWAFTGLLAIGLYGRTISDPTTVWGTMTHNLLGAGAIGLMIAAIFSANMDGNATAALDASASVIKNIYLPMSRSATERSQMIVGRIVLVFVLVTSVFMARWMVNRSIADIFQNMLSVLSTIGPAFWLVYFWRRLTTTAVAVQMSVSIIMTVVLTFFAPLAFPDMRTDPELTLRTAPATVTSQRAATTDDVKAGRATTPGMQITVDERIPPAAVYFESTVRSRRGDTTSPWKGEGPFRPQIWLLSKLGIDFSTWRKPAIKSAALLFDAIMPFILLVAVSLFTKRNSESVLRDFYARIHTPAVADPVKDAALVAAKISDPELVERDKLFPGTDLEFWKPTRADIVGFLVCVAFVLAIIGLYMLVASIGQ